VSFRKFEKGLLPALMAVAVVVAVVSVILYVWTVPS
jgi:hypothetical protein